LDELDEDLLLELNQVAHDNQLAYLPFARSGRAEALLFEHYPELAERIERGKRAKIDAIVLSNKYADSDAFSTSFRAQSLEEVAASPLRQRNRRRASKDAKSPALTPALKGKGSVQDLMFEMSDGDDNESGTPRKIKPPQFSEEKAVETPIGSPEAPWVTARKQSLDRGEDIPPKSISPLPPPAIQPTRAPGLPWGSTPLASAKLDLKDIMALDSSAMPSNLSLGFSRRQSEQSPKPAQPKMSQKERKRLQQAQLMGTPMEKPQPVPPTMSPWQATSQRKPSNSPLVTPAAQPSPKATPQASRTSSTPQLNMRQTIANNGPAGKKDKRTASQSAQGAPSNANPAQARPAASERGMSVSTDPIPTPRSVRHIPLPQHSPTSPSQNLSMMEILSLQEAEKTSIRDAAAKRSLQEIQQEQEFQQWWEQESRRVIEEEEATKRAVERASKSIGRGRGRGRGGRGGKGGAKEKKEKADEGDRAKHSKDVSAGPVTQQPPAPKATLKHEGGDGPAIHTGGNSARGGRGRIGRGGRGGGRGGGGRQSGPPRDGATTAPPPTQRQPSAQQS
jgi:hypothetical protein